MDLEIKIIFTFQSVKTFANPEDPKKAFFPEKKGKDKTMEKWAKENISENWENEESKF